MATGITVQGADLDAIFAPYVQGTSPALTGYTLAGVDINTRYAPLVYGTAAAATGYDVNGADFNTLWAAIGTANYPIAANGKTYTHGYTIPANGNGYSELTFRIVTGNTWQILGSDPGTTGVVIASGQVPSTAINVQYTWGTPYTPTGYVSAGTGTLNNGASAQTAVTGNPSAYFTTATNGASSGSRQTAHPFTVDFFDASGSNISHSVCTLIGETDGSA